MNLVVPRPCETGPYNKIPYLNQEIENSSNSLLDRSEYLEIFHLGKGESTVLLGTNWEMRLTFYL